VRQKDNVKN